MKNSNKILNGLELLYPNSVIPQLKRSLEKFPESIKNMEDAFSLGQLQSKLWLIDNLPDNLGTIFVCAGWYGTLSALMFERAKNKFNKIRSFDKDESCAPIADTLNRMHVMNGWQFKSSTLDILQMSYPLSHFTVRSDGTSALLTEMPDTIINTSCEHILDFNAWYKNIPSGMLLILQSNNYFEIDDHVNCVQSISEFSSQTPMSTVLYEGELDLGKYKRFMRIGYK